jgi:hypothetical protein
MIHRPRVAILLAFMLMVVPAPAITVYTYSEAMQLYEAGEFSQALPLLEDLASGGDARAQYHLGMLYGLGQGVTRDDRKARHWLQRSANQGNPAAMYELANLYFAGHGGAQDLDSAVYLYGLAAERGSRAAQLKLAELFAAGNAVAQDEERAYIYLLIANPGPGSNAAALRATLEAKLTERQQARAREFAVRWLARHSGSEQ